MFIEVVLTCYGGPEIIEICVGGASSVLNMVLKCLILCIGGTCSSDVVLHLLILCSGVSAVVLWSCKGYFYA